MLRQLQQLAGSRLLRAGSLLARKRIKGKTAEARARVLDSRGIDDRLESWIAEEAEKRNASLSADDIRRLAEIASKPFGGYRSPSRGDMAVILCSYNPAGWKRPPKLLYETCEMIVAAGVKPVVSQVVLPGRSPSRVPAGCREIVYTSDSVMFHKENLWNLSAAVTSEPKLFFIDGDIVFSRRDIFDAVSRALDEHDVIQPFDTSCWLSQNGGIERTRKTSAEAIRDGLRPILTQYHPGFSWAMTRDFFDRIGGFYERHPLGSGDTAFAFSLTPGEPPWPKTPAHVFANTPSYKAYRQGVQSTSPRVSPVAGIAYHKWHGNWVDRKYEARYQYLPPLVDGEYPMFRRPDGLLEWSDVAFGKRALEYFVGRKEDG